MRDTSSLWAGARGLFLLDGLDHHVHGEERVQGLDLALKPVEQDGNEGGSIRSWSRTAVAVLAGVVPIRFSSSSARW
jgi:hypothetical protein